MTIEEQAEVAVSKVMQEIDYNPDRAEEPIMLEVFTAALRAHEAEAVENIYCHKCKCCGTDKLNNIFGGMCSPCLDKKYRYALQKLSERNQDLQKCEAETIERCARECEGVAGDYKTMRDRWFPDTETYDVRNAQTIMALELSEKIRALAQKGTKE